MIEASRYKSPSTQEGSSHTMIKASRYKSPSTQEESSHMTIGASRYKSSSTQEGSSHMMIKASRYKSPSTQELGITEEDGECLLPRAHDDVIFYPSAIKMMSSCTLAATILHRPYLL